MGRERQEGDLALSSHVANEPGNDSKTKVETLLTSLQSEKCPACSHVSKIRCWHAKFCATPLMPLKVKNF